MTYQQTIDYLFTRLPMFSRIGAAAYKADLTNTIKLCEWLDNPQEKFKTIHIAGTNGKGSVSHMLASILQTAGLNTGLYTSPHLKDFRERIKVNGEMINEKFVIDFTEKINPLIEKIEPSFFEITVAMAFDYFAEQKVDIAIIETGLGGRLDSTNIIIPELSVITNIGWDHMNLLGDSLEKIALEKAGIIKMAVPVVIGETIPETNPIFEQVAKELLTVLEACSQLQQKGWPIDDKIINHGLKHAKKNTGLHGRWEIIHHSPMVVMDVAHNVDGIRQLVQQSELTEHRELHIIIGMVKDKDIDNVLALLPQKATYYFTKAQIPRALPENELMEKAKKVGLKGYAFPEVNGAISFALKHTHPDDLVIICGSVFLVGEVNTSIH
ncbi:MAG: bifunctional folylpolyglutamate synthase/dihydrofolate synthase [Chitinophagaceae bacterium]|nr:bifunctional folylpolyglutamate synthase/dihydrofolate synthase [Chitinophagaceae bacterium]